MRKYTLALFFIGLYSCGFGESVQFAEWFENRTLRIDCIFTGDSVNQHLGVSELSSMPYWAGRRNNLDSLYLKGAGQLYVHDAETGTLIYTTSFSTLFQEWQATKEALQKSKSFENTFLIPMPKRPATIRIELMNSWQKITGTMTFPVDPKDILIRKLDSCTIQPHKEILHSGSIEHCVDVAFVAEGYTEEQMDVFYQDVEHVADRIFAHQPFTKLKNRFNITAVGCPSKEEGVSIPGQGIWKETTLGSSFDTFYSDRYLTTLHVKRLYDMLAGIPFDQIIVLVNTDKYGGGGIYNLYMLSSAHHKSSLPVCVHEFGHSFAGLGDEYDYGDGSSEYYHKGIEPWEPNITTLHDFKSKWADMVQPDTPVPTPESESPETRHTRVGLFEGAGYMSKGVYRPVQECRMKTNDVPAFCPVCQRAIERMIRYLTE